jgi:hypothetical protein
MICHNQFFSQVLFYSKDKVLDQPFASYLAAINRQSGAVFSYSLINEKDQLINRLNFRTLIVLEARDQDLEKELFELGGAFILTRSEFQNNSNAIFNLQRAVRLQKILLAFLDQRTAKIASSLFQLYGYDTEIIESEQHLVKEVKKGNFHLILNQDLPGATKSQIGSRERIFRMLLDLRYHSEEFSLTIVKDFSQGSLFEDINSSVRKLANIMLSPDEFLFFFRNYLQRELILEIQQDYANLLSLPVHQQPYSRGNGQEQISKGLNLKNLKVAYKTIVQEAQNQFKERQKMFLEESLRINILHSVTAWIESYLELPEDTLSRASFEFFEEPVPGLPENASPTLLKVLPFQADRAESEGQRRSHS